MQVILGVATSLYLGYEVAAISPTQRGATQAVTWRTANSDALHRQMTTSQNNNHNHFDDNDNKIVIIVQWEWLLLQYVRPCRAGFKSGDFSALIVETVAYDWLKFIIVLSQRGVGGTDTETMVVFGRQSDLRIWSKTSTQHRFSGAHCSWSLNISHAEHVQVCSSS